MDVVVLVTVKACTPPLTMLAVGLDSYHEVPLSRDDSIRLKKRVATW
jgi:hypothetical protein